MSLQLDDRRRAMLREMGVAVWLPPAVAQPVLPVAVMDAPSTRALAAPIAPLTPPLTANPAPAHGAPASHTDVAELDWPGLLTAVAGCQACALRVGCKAPVMPAEARPRQTDWLVLGEPPDEDEVRTGVAFAGPTGQLLDNMLLAVRVNRSGMGAGGARLSNVVKCRSAVVRNPVASELLACSVYLRREVALVQPRVILAMGRFAALSLLGQSYPELLQLPFGKWRGQVYRAHGVPVVVTYHPSQLLRAPKGKAHAWADLCLAQTQARLDTVPTEPPPERQMGAAPP